MKIKWFELLVQMDPSKSLKGGKKKGTKVRKKSSTTSRVGKKSSSISTKRSSIKESSIRRGSIKTSAKTSSNTSKKQPKFARVGPILVPYNRSNGKCHFPVVRRTVLHTVKVKKTEKVDYFLRFELAFIESFIDTLHEKIELSNELLNTTIEEKMK